MLVGWLYQGGHFGMKIPSETSRSAKNPKGCMLEMEI
jgi:hypothetical protein